jgi:hypothetical protein
VLLTIGMLSTSGKGNWYITHEIISLGSGEFLYFTRKEDAVESARLALANATYYWEIRQISQIISKKEVLGN